jgi:hypothetical protein
MQNVAGRNPLSRKNVSHYSKSSIIFDYRKCHVGEFDFICEGNLPGHGCLHGQRSRPDRECLPAGLYRSCFENFTAHHLNPVSGVADSEYEWSF